MRMVRNMVMALAVLVSTAATYGASALWYSSPTGGTQGQGQVLNLTCDTSGAPGSCSWVVRLNMQSSAGLQSWLMDLSTAPGNGVSAAGGTTTNSIWTQPGAAGVGGTGPALYTGARGQNIGTPAAGTNQLIEFTLSRSFNTGDLSSAEIFARIPADPAFFFYNGLDDDIETVSVGPNAGVYANNTTGPVDYANAVIRIQNVPEPSSLVLLALGGIAALRRRVGR